MNITIIIKEKQKQDLSIEQRLRHELLRLRTFGSIPLNLQGDTLVLGCTSNTEMFTRAGIIQSIVEDEAFYGTNRKNGLYLQLKCGRSWEAVIEKLKNIESIKIDKGE